MNVQPDCFPCILRRVLSISRRITDDPWLQHKVLGKVMAELVDADRDVTPAELMAETHGHVVKALGASDPFQEERAHWFQELTTVLENIESTVEDSEDPLLTALAFAARANAFDDETLSRAKLRRELNRLVRKDDGPKVDEEFSFADDYSSFVKELAEAKTLMFIHDSGPGLVFDKLVIDRLVARRPELSITSVVRHQPILLDATHDDSERAGIAAHAAVSAVIDPGKVTLGCLPNECSREFREVFEAVDMVLAKGQASVETLEACERRIYFMLRVKCDTMAKAQGAKVGDTLLYRA